MNYDSIIESRLQALLAELRNKKGVFPQRTKLRIEKVLQNGIGQYNFDLKEAIANHLTTFELKRDDIIIPNAISFLIAISHKVNGTEVEQLYSFAPKNDGVNPSVFPVGFVKDDIEALYNGYVQWTVGSTVAWENFPMEVFKKVFRQEGAFVLDSNDQPVQEGIQPEFDIEKMLHLLYAKYYVAGTQDHQMSVNFPAAGLDFSLNDSNYTAKLVLYIDCWKIKNGTKILNVNIDENDPLAAAAWSMAN